MMATEGSVVSLKLLLKTVLLMACLTLRIEAAKNFLDLLEDPSDIATLVKAASFLANYGYITPEKGNTAPEQMDASEMSRAIRKMQKYAAVEQTGVLDKATIKMMKKSRCGVHDDPENLRGTRIEGNTTDTRERGEAAGRMKRYAVAGLKYKWEKNDITYKIMNYPDNSTSRITPKQVRRDTARAFKVWSDVTPLSFTEVSVDEEADIKISFGSYYHTDIVRDPIFDGPGGTLAHAFFPNSGWEDANGDIHLDDSETFLHQEFAKGTDYFYTVAHEMGHALGMAHATNKASLMFPWDKGYGPDFTLAVDDIRGIQLLYGSNPEPPVTTTTRPEHKLCSRSVDSLTMIKKVLHVFSGNKFWKLSASKDIIGPAEGTVSREHFKKLTKGTTAVYTRWDKKVLFFKGKNYWTYDGTDREQKTALKIADLGLPKSPSAIMHDRNNRHTYFFKWSKVWKYDDQAQTVVEGFPKAVHRVFIGLPRKSRVRAAYMNKEGDRFLLIDRQYYRFPSGQDELDPEYPIDFLQEFFGCQPE